MPETPLSDPLSSTLEESSTAPGDIIQQHTKQTQQPEELIQQLMDSHPSHLCMVYEEADRYEVFLIHKSSIPTHSTCAVLRAVIPEGQQSYGEHHWFRGTKADVNQQLKQWLSL